MDKHSDSGPAFSWPNGMPAKPQPKLATKEDVFAAVTNYSRAKRLAAAVFGPTARVFHRPGEPVKIVYEDTGELAGSGKSFPDAFSDASRDVKLEDILRGKARAVLRSFWASGPARPR